MKAPASATGSSAMSSVAGCSSTWSTATDDDPAEAYRTVRGELAAYGHGLDEKPEIVALSKIDALRPRTGPRRRRSFAKAAGRTPLILSAVTGEGVEQALRMVAREISAATVPDPNEVPAETEEEWRP